ncbi:MAG: endonuclease NucS [Candidatus Zapsychrus exili]|nr:endonuclease NucS [Candidatus Zapsychrus exili]
MEVYERKDISEIVLEDKIRQCPELIEEGLKFVDRQKKTPRGPLDLLLVDSKMALIVAELKIVEDDNMLMQALDYYDYIANNIDTLARIYKQSNIDPTQTPRLMLIAPSFSHLLINRCKWITEDIQISLYAFQYITFNQGEKETTVYIPVEIQPPVSIEKEPATIDKHISYIIPNAIKKLAKQILDEIQSWDKAKISIDSKQWGASIKVSGSVIAYWEPRRNFIRISTYDKDNKWQSSNISTEEQNRQIIDMVKNYYTSLL